MLSGITPRERALSVESDAGLRLSRPFESCENEPAAETFTVLPETAVLAPQTDRPAGRAEVPQRSAFRPALDADRVELGGGQVQVQPGKRHLALAIDEHA